MPIKTQAEWQREQNRQDVHYQRSLDIRAAEAQHIEARTEQRRRMRQLQIEHQEIETEDTLKKVEEYRCFRAQQLEQDARFAEAMLRTKNDKLADEKRRQQIRESSDELKQLEAKLRAAYALKELDLQITEKRLMEIRAKMDEVLEFIKSTLPTVQEELLRSKFEEIWVENVNDLEEVDCVSDLVPPLKLVQARTVQKAISLHFDKACLPESGTINHLNNNSPQLENPSTPTHLPSTSNIPNLQSPHTPQSFEIPYVKFSPGLKQKFDSKKVATKAELSDMIKVLSNDIYHCMGYPGRDTIRRIVTKIVKKYPQSFEIVLADDNSVLGDGADLLERKLTTRLLSLKRMANTMDEDFRETPKRRKTTKDRYGTIHFLPEAFPDDETYNTQALKKEWLQNEFEKTKREQDVHKIHLYMDITYALQRQNITEEGVSTADIRQQWPFLFEKDYLAAHFEQLMGFDLFNKANEAISNVMPVVISFLKTKVSIDGESKNLSKSRHGLRDNLIKIRGKNVFSIADMVVTMMDWWGQPKEMLFQIYEDTATIAEVEEKSSVPHPHVAVIGGDIFQNSGTCVPVFENNSFKELLSPDDSFILTFAQYYIYSIAYPNQIGASMEFVQRAIFNIDGEGTKIVRDKTKSNPPAKNGRVVSFLSDLAHHKRLWKL